MNTAVQPEKSVKRQIFFREKIWIFFEHNRKSRDAQRLERKSCMQSGCKKSRAIRASCDRRDKLSEEF